MFKPYRGLKIGFSKHIFASSCSITTTLRTKFVLDYVKCVHVKQIFFYRLVDRKWIRRVFFIVKKSVVLVCHIDDLDFKTHLFIESKFFSSSFIKQMLHAYYDVKCRSIFVVRITLSREITSDRETLRGIIGDSKVILYKNDFLWK